MARLRIETAPEITVFDEAFIIKAAANATAPLIQLKDSSGSNVGNISASGVLTVTSVAVSNGGTSATDLATRAYVDSIASGVNWHEAVTAATAAALPSCVYDNGTLGVGATLEASANGALPTIDGITLETGWSLLVKNQADAKQNGIYQVHTLGTVSTKWKLIRRSDSDNSIARQVAPGDSVYILSGTVSADCAYALSNSGTGTNGAIVIGTDNIEWTLFAGAATIVAGNGIVRTDTIISVSPEAGKGITVTANGVSLSTVTTNTTSGANTTSFLSNVAVDTYGRITGKEFSSVSFAGYATLANPALTGVPTAPTAANATSNTQLATTAFVQNAATIAVSDAGNNAILKSLVDAKGDIIVGTADNTSARVGIGSNGTVLRANSSTTSGVEWGTISPVITLGGDLTGSVTLTNLGSATLTATIAADSVALGTDTTGNYVSNVTAGTGITVTHTPGEGSSAAVAITNTAVTAGSYTYSSITVNAQGQLTAASNGTAPVTSVTGGTGVTISGTTTPTVAIGQSVATNAAVTFATVETTGNIIVGGNLTVNGTTTTFNTDTLAVEDNIVVLNSNVTAAPALNAGIEVERGTSDNVLVRWNETNDKWEVTNDGTTYGNIVTTADANTVTSTMILNGTILDADINASANIALSKLATSTAGNIIVYNASGVPTAVAETGDVTISDTGVTAITANTIVNADINTAAAIDKTKISGTAITAADSGTVTSAMIADATIVNADISATAAIEQSKIADTILNQQVASYTLVLTDKNKMVEISNASATTLTIPADNTVNMAIGATVNVLQTGAGQITLAGAAGVTLNTTPGAKLRTQWSSATLIKRAANTWVALGDLSA